MDDLDARAINLSGASRWTPKPGHLGNPRAPAPLAPAPLILSCATTRPTRLAGPRPLRAVAATPSILLYSMLYLSGYGLELDDLGPSVSGEPHPGPPRGRPRHPASR